MIKITHIMYGDRKIGIALHKMKEGDNEFIITAKNKAGDYICPGTFSIDKGEAIEKYGVSSINRNLLGVWIPLADLERICVEKR